MMFIFRSLFIDIESASKTNLNIMNKNQEIPNFILKKSWKFRLCDGSNTLVVVFIFGSLKTNSIMKKWGSK